MNERSIRFNDEMIRAILRDKKTQTRRPVKVQPNKDWYPYHRPDRQWTWCVNGSGVSGGDTFQCPFGQVGDRLWVREAWKPTCQWGEPNNISYIRYRADSSRHVIEHTLGGVQTDNWRPSIHMPEWASRITLEITDIRVERVQEINEADCVAEDCPATIKIGPPDCYSSQFGKTESSKSPIETFQAVWNNIYASKGFGFDTNCWVWVITFRRVMNTHTRSKEK